MPRIMNRMGWSISAAVALALVATLAGVIYAGPLDPPRAPAPTQSNLIYQPADCGGFPIVVGTHGAWALAENIVMPGGCAKNGLELNDFVTLDLRGFTVQGTPGALAGISSGTTAAAVTNGTIVGWPGGGVDFGSAKLSQLSHLRIMGNGPVGGTLGQLDLGSKSTLTDCAVGNSDLGALGIVVVGSGSVVDGCDVSGNAFQGIQIAGSENRITHNHAYANDYSSGCADIWIAGPNNVVEDNTAERNGPSGLDSCPFYVAPGAAGSIIQRNVARGGGANNYDNIINCPTCDIGPISSAALATSPSANISD